MKKAILLILLGTASIQVTVNNNINIGDYTPPQVEVVEEVVIAKPVYTGPYIQPTFAEKVSRELDNMALNISPNINSPEAKQLLSGIAKVESNLKHRVEYGGGAARGLLQMEELTAYRDAYEYCVNNEKINSYVNTRFGKGHHFGMIENHDAYAITMARIYLMRFSDVIPKTTRGQARYWKKRWNTIQGAGTVRKYLMCWNTFK